MSNNRRDGVIGSAVKRDFRRHEVVNHLVSEKLDACSITGDVFNQVRKVALLKISSDFILAFTKPPEEVFADHAFDVEDSEVIWDLRAYLFETLLEYLGCCCILLDDGEID